MFEESRPKGIKKYGVAKLFNQSLTAGGPAQTYTTNSGQNGAADIFDLKNFRKGLRSNLTGMRWS